jgi:Tol biopolymer transport system component
LIDADTNGVGSVVSPATVPHLTSDGSLVAFECPDGSMVAGDRNRDYDVFVRNRPQGTTELISAHDPTLASATPNGLSTLSATSISRDGRYVAFASEADNLVANDTNKCRDVFVRDLFATVPRLVSVDTNGFSGDGLSTDAAISADGRFVAFTSAADNLVAGDTNRAQDVFLRDLHMGATTVISLSNGGTAEGNKASYSPIVGVSGRFVLFRSLASNLAAGSFTGENLFLRDTQTGATYALTTSGAGVAAMTPDGRFVVFASTGGVASVYVWDAQAAARIYTNATAVGAVAISPDGRLMAYATSAGLYTVDVASGNLTTVDSTALTYLDLRISQDRHWLSCTRRPSLVSVFDYQVYLYDLGAQTNRVVSLSTDGVNPGNGRSDSADISADGRFIAYRSAAGNLVAGGDTNGVPDIYLFDVQIGATTLLSAGQPGSFSPNNRSLTPVFSGDGHTLFFQSWASDLTAQDFNHYSDIFAYAFFYGVLLPAQNAGEGPWLSWPWAPGTSYGVQFKNALDDSGWQPLSGTITNSGTRGWVQDAAPNPGQRVYRVFGF